ncbi:MAG: hypothetical protein WCT77_03795 [Bacteroidota bacterium]
MSTENQENIKYFPENVISENLNYWYSKMMRDFKLDSFYEKASDTNKQLFRFVWGRAHNNPITITIEIFENDYGELRLLEYSGGVFYPENAIMSNCLLQLFPYEIESFLKIIDNNCFWDILSANPYSRGLDGSTWIIEGIKNGKYHFIERWAPMQTDKVVAGIGLCMIGLSRMKFDRIY